MKKICGFQGEYRYLSNFSPYKIIDNYIWPTAEHYYQSFKTNCPNNRIKILNCKTPGEAKKIARQINIRSDWEYIKIGIMQRVVYLKFIKNLDIQEKLLNTKDTILIEENNWNDTFWGTYNGNGLNMLGNILMIVRSQIILSKYC